MTDSVSALASLLSEMQGNEGAPHPLDGDPQELFPSLTGPEQATMAAIIAAIHSQAPKPNGHRNLIDLAGYPHAEEQFLSLSVLAQAGFLKILAAFLQTGAIDEARRLIGRALPLVAEGCVKQLHRNHYQVNDHGTPYVVRGKNCGCSSPGFTCAHVRATEIIAASTTRSRKRRKPAAS